MHCSKKRPCSQPTRPRRVRLNSLPGRMKHAWKGPTPHFNVPPGLYGRPFLRHHFRKQILDALHLALLGLPKTPWKFGIKNNASDDARVQLSEQLAAWKHPLDMKRKDDGRVREQKWFTGEKFISFCAGTGGSPGGPIAIATLVMIIADDLMLRGVDHGSGDAVRLAAPAAGRGSTPGGRGGAARGGRGRGRGGSLADRLSAVMRTHHSWTVVFPPPVLFKLRGCSCSIRRLPLRLPPIRMIS